MKRNARILFGIVIGVCLLTSASFGQAIEPLGRAFNFWNGASRITLSDSYAIVACGESGVQIIDISSPSDPGSISVFDDLMAPVLDVELAASRLYVLTARGVEILDASNLPELRKLGSIEVDSTIYDFSAAPNYLAVSSFTQDRQTGTHNRVQIYDVHRLDNPVLLETLTPTQTGAFANVLVRATKMLVEADTSIQIWEIGEDNQVTRKGDISFESRPTDFEGRSDFVQIAFGSKWETWDIVNTNEPERLTTQQISFHVTGLRLSYPWLTLYSYWDREYRVFDVSNQNSPRELGGASMPSVGFAAAVGNEYGGWVVDGWDRLYSMGLGGNLSSLFQSRGWINAFEFSGDYLYASLLDSGFAVIDVTNPRTPIVRSIKPLSGWTKGITVRDSYVFTSGRGMHIYDCSNPTDPVEMSFYTTNGNAPVQQTILNGDIAYLLLDVDQPRIDILDVSNLRRPRLVRSVDVTPVNGKMVYNPVGEYLYIAGECTNWNRSYNFEVVDVSEPAAAGVIGGFQLAFDESFTLNDIAIDESLLALSLKDVGVILYDLSSPENPTYIGDYAPSKGGFGGLAFYDHHLYAAGSVDGLSIFDVSFPALPHLVCSFKDFINAEKLTVRSDGIVALSTGSSLRLYDSQSSLNISNDDSPIPTGNSLISTYPNPFNSSSTVDVTQLSNAPLQLILFDMNGRAWDSWSLPSGIKTRTNRFMIDGNHLPSGSFYLQAISAGRSKSLPIVHIK